MKEEQLLFLLLMEEAAEVQQVCSKIIRFGPFDSHPKTNNIQNCQLLKEELNDMYAIIDLLEATYVEADFKRDETMICNKLGKIDKYKKISKELGRVV